MANYGALITRIGTDIDRSGDTSVIEAAIQDAIVRHEAERFTFNDTTFRLTTVADQEFYTLPDDLRTRSNGALQGGETLLEIDAATIIYNESGYPLTAYNDAEAEICGLTSYRGQPTGYSWTDTELRLEPIPDQAYPIYINGLKRLSDLSDTNDTNAWTSDQQASRLIRETAKGLIYRDYLRNYDAASAADESAELVSMVEYKKRPKHH